jgi:site-specific DNA-methyltransferase (adenine-specific)
MSARINLASLNRPHRVGDTSWTGSRRRNVISTFPDRLRLANAVPYGGKKKGADSGIDGFVYFKPDGKTTEKAVVSVKGGENVSVAMIRDMGHVVDREKAKIGIFITLAEATGPMKTEAVKAGFYETPHHGKVAKLQIFTIADLFEGKKPQIPFVDVTAFKSATREVTVQQGKLL